MQLPKLSYTSMKYVTKILLIISLWLCFIMIYSLNVWLLIYIVITLVCRHKC